MDYDSAEIDYEKLLNIFWNLQSPIGNPPPRQYMSIIFYHNDEQRQLAMSTKKKFEDQIGHSVYTEIVPYTKFYRAEGYHQKYYLQQVTKLYQPLKEKFDDYQSFVDSTMIARVNGYVGGNGTREGLLKQLEALSVDQATIDKIKEVLIEIGR